MHQCCGRGRANKVEFRKDPQTLYGVPEPTGIILKQGLLLPHTALLDPFKKDLWWYLLVDFSQRSGFYQHAPIVITGVFLQNIAIEFY